MKLTLKQTMIWKDNYSVQVQDHQSWQMGDIILQQSDLLHSSVVLLGNPSETGTEGEEGKRIERKTREGSWVVVLGSPTRHLSIHLVLHVWGWRATTDHTLGGHVVTVRRLRGGSSLVHTTRAHGHVLSGRLQAHNIDTKTHISWLETHRSLSHSKKKRQSRRKQIKAKMSVQYVVTKYFCDVR